VATGLAAGRSDWPAVARWHAMANALGQQGSLTREPFDDAFVQGAVALARQALGEFAFGASAEVSNPADVRASMAAVTTWLGRALDAAG
jgi:hypothetical protein